VRLRGCVAIELFVGATVAAAISGAAIWGVAELRVLLADDAGAAGQIAYAAEREAAAAREAERKNALAPSTEPRLASVTGEIIPAAGETAATETEPPADGARPAWSGQFLGRSDEELLAPLRDSPVTAVKLNRGGSSLSLRIDFESGGRAACKPNQIHMHSQPRREIAAYRVNRLLGLSSVPPAVGRRFQVADLGDRFRPDARRERGRFLTENIQERDGTSVLGQLTWWLPVLNKAAIDGFEIDTTDGVVTWKRYLAAGGEVPAASQPMAAQISTLLLFDFIINNSDRWSGGNIKTSADPGVLVFLDNTLSFGGDPNGHNRVRTYLYRSQKFSRRLVDRLRQLDDALLEEALTRDIDPFPLLLEKNELRALGKRRDFALRYIDDLIAQHGDQAVLAFP
jgi:hypothetical protein